jgi:uncharacterized membrane protein
MTSWRDRINQIGSRTRIVVSRLFVHLAGQEVAPFLGVLNNAAQQAVEADGDLQVMGEGLAEICQSLLQYETYWQSAANEGDVFWDEGNASDYVTELFTDSAQRYGSAPELSEAEDFQEQPLSVPITQNVIVMLTVAYEGEVPELETDLASVSALKAGLKALVNLHYNGRLRAIQVHFSPAQLGNELTSDQILLNYPELLPV